MKRKKLETRPGVFQLSQHQKVFCSKEISLPNCLTDDHVKVIVMAVSVHCKVAKKKTYAIKISLL